MYVCEKNNIKEEEENPRVNEDRNYKRVHSVLHAYSIFNILLIIMRQNSKKAGMRELEKLENEKLVCSSD